MYKPHRKDFLLPSRETTIKLFCTGDNHLESSGHSAELRQDLFKRVKKTEHCGLLIAGDYKDNDRPSMRLRKLMIMADRLPAKDNGVSTITHEDAANMGMIDKHILPDLAPIADKVLGYVDGDHFEIYNNGETSGQYICRNLKIPYLGVRMGTIRLHFCYEKAKNNFISYDILMRHGRGGVGTPGGSVNALVAQNKTWEGYDLYLGAHNHQLHVHAEARRSFNWKAERYEDGNIVYARIGSMLKSYLTGKATYAEAAEYGGLPVGWTEINITTHRNQDTNRNMAIKEVSGGIVMPHRMLL